jgi:hypothetical protein
MTFTSLEFGITCGRHGLESEECIFPGDINGVVWSGYSLLSFVYCVCLFCVLIGLVQPILLEDNVSIQ